MKLQLVSHNEDLVEHTFKILNEFNMLARNYMGL